MSSTLSPTALSLIQTFKSQTNGAADGTGVLILLKKAKSLLGNNVPSFLTDYVLGLQTSTFGDYPTHKDIAPSSIFMAVFFILCIAHFFIFTKNFLRGHRFWLSLLLGFYCLFRVLGFLLRIVWSCNVNRIQVGLASAVFVVIPSIILASFNLVLAQRIFTWRHPRIGSSKLFWAWMISTYCVVTGIVVMGILGAVIPYIYFLSKHRKHMCQQVVQAAAVFNCIYSLLAAILVLIAFLMKPSTEATAKLTYQPWWIESFGMFYYVPKNAAQRAEETFKERDPEAFDAIRIVASTNLNHNTIERVQSVSSKSGKLEHNNSILIVALTTATLLLSSVFRCVSTFIDQTHSKQSWIFKPVVMYIMIGLLETIVNVIYLAGRIDLRFYRPDRLKERHRATGSFSSEGGLGDEELGDETLRSRSYSNTKV